MTITLETQGRRIYIRGNTYPIKAELRAAGAKWDGDAKAWWIGTTKRAEIERVLAGLPEPAADAARPSTSESRDAPGENATVAARATYKGKVYYVAGRVERGRTRYDNRVEWVTSRDGARVLLYFRDGSRQFWAAGAEVQVQRRYDRPTTIRSLREYAERAKAQDRSYDERQFVGERGAYQSEYSATRHDRTPGRGLGTALWLRHEGQRLAVVLVGYETAVYVRSDDAEDMGRFGLESGWYGVSHYRAARREEYEALQARDPREDGVCVEQQP